MGYPSVHPTGTIIYNKDKAYNGYTIFSTPGGALLIDMNGREVNRWAGLGGFPNKLLPGGQVFGTSGARGGEAAYQDQLDLLQVDWDGTVLSSFASAERAKGAANENASKSAMHTGDRSKMTTSRMA